MGIHDFSEIRAREDIPVRRDAGTVYERLDVLYAVGGAERSFLHHVLH